LLGLLERVGFAADQHEVGAGLGQSLGDGAAQTAAAARDEGALAVQAKEVEYGHRDCPLQSFMGARRNCLTMSDRLLAASDQTHYASKPLATVFDPPLSEHVVSLRLVLPNDIDVSKGPVVMFVPASIQMQADADVPGFDRSVEPAKRFELVTVHFKLDFFAFRKKRVNQGKTLLPLFPIQPVVHMSHSLPESLALGNLRP